jgi:hypothetical protein
MPGSGDHRFTPYIEWDNFLRLRIIGLRLIASRRHNYDCPSAINAFRDNGSGLFRRDARIIKNLIFILNNNTERKILQYVRPVAKYHNGDLQ